MNLVSGKSVRIILHTKNIKSLHAHHTLVYCLLAMGNSDSKPAKAEKQTKWKDNLFNHHLPFPVIMDSNKF
jgi:hypothetical protein